MASNVIQIVDFGIKLISDTQEIYHAASGTTKNNVTSGEIANDLIVLYKDLVGKNSTFDRSSADDVALGRLVDRCVGEAENLTRLLAGLEVPAGATQWASFRKAIKSARKERKVEDIEARLRKIQKQVNSRLQLMMR